MSGPFDVWLENKTRQRAAQKEVEKLRARIITSELLSVDYSESELAYERSVISPFCRGVLRNWKLVSVTCQVGFELYFYLLYMKYGICNIFRVPVLSVPTHCHIVQRLSLPQMVEAEEPEQKGRKQGESKEEAGRQGGNENRS